MDDLIKMVSEKTGLPADKAKQAAEAVIGFISDKLPGPIASQVRGFLDGDGGGDLADKAKKGLGGLLGG